MERSYFFDSTDTDKRIYQAADFARFHAQIIGNGVSNTANLPDLAVEAKQNMIVTLGAGYAFANGYMYENTTALDLEHDIAEPDVDRIDRIVICFDNDPAQRRVYAYIKKGIPGSNVPPEITRDSYIFEISVARVKILAGKSFIEQHQITDERAIDAVCGYIPLHNIYRGLSIDEFGMVSMPNQSFVKAFQTGLNVPFPAKSEVAIPIVGIEEDHQGEIVNNTFVPKTSGVFDIYVEVGFPATLPQGTDIHMHVFINGERSFPVVARTIGSLDNFVFGTGIDKFNKGDVVDIRLKHSLSQTITGTLIRVRFAKVS